MSVVRSQNGHGAINVKNIHVRRMLQQQQQQNSPRTIELSSTPGGTIFGTTPGGTRIVYDRSFLLQCRNSPMAKSPPPLPQIPGVTCLPVTTKNVSRSSKKARRDAESNQQSPSAEAHHSSTDVTEKQFEDHPPENSEDSLFELDM
jgi:hypothetical protein